MGAVARTVRGALELMDASVIQVDVPTSAHAVAELSYGARMFVTAYTLDEGNGYELALSVLQQYPDIAILIIADEDSPESDAEDITSELPYVVLRRPLDGISLMRMIEAAIQGRKLRISLTQTNAAMIAVTESELVPVPTLDLAHASRILDQMLVDVGAMEVVLASRVGELLVERGAAGTLNRERLVNMLAPSMNTGRDVRDLVGGQLSTIQFYDGEAFDIFVLSVGLHHFILVVYDGQGGARMFGAVNRFGRRAAEDVIALIGAGAFIWESPMSEPDGAQRSTKRMKPVRLDVPVELELAKAEIEPSPAVNEPLDAAVEPLGDLDFDRLFGGDNPTEGDLDDLFAPDALKDLNAEQQRKGKLSWDQAKEIGLIP
jgi:hypothetical protein